MMKLIVGNKGSGKTTTLISMVNDAVAVSKGNVVCIEKGSVMTFDINYKARLVDIDHYDIVGYDALYGFLTGILAGNYDITHVFVDNFYKLVEDKSPESFDAFIAWLDKFSEAEKIEFVISVSADAETASESVKKHFI